MLKVFVTKDRPWRYLNEVERTGKAIFVYQSCISLKVTENATPPDTDWIFFSSPSGVRLFLTHFAPPEQAKIAAIGEGTAAALAEAKLNAHFIPASADTAEAVKEFAEALEDNASVLYPRSTESLLRLREVITGTQLVDWPFYEPVPDPPKHPVYDDYLVFTSPSNAKAYLKSQRVRSGQRIVAIGESTARGIMELGITGFLISASPTPEGIWQSISEDAGIPL